MSQDRGVDWSLVRFTVTVTAVSVALILGVVWMVGSSVPTTTTPTNGSGGVWYQSPSPSKITLGCDNYLTADAARAEINSAVVLYNEAAAQVQNYSGLPIVREEAKRRLSEVQLAIETARSCKYTDYELGLTPEKLEFFGVARR